MVYDKPDGSFMGMGLLDEYFGTNEEGWEEWSVWRPGRGEAERRFVDPNAYEKMLQEFRDKKLKDPEGELQKYMDDFDKEMAEMLAEAGMAEDLPDDMQMYLKEKETAKTKPPISERLGEMSISEIAREIRKDWSQQGKGVNYAAKPYLEAMGASKASRTTICLTLVNRLSHISFPTLVHGRAILLKWSKPN